MNAGKFFRSLCGWIFGLLGVSIVVGSVILALASLDAPVRFTEIPQGAMDQSQNLMEAVSRGDFVSAGKLMYGQPDLGVNRAPEDAAGQKIWDAFVKSISYEFTGDCYATDSGIARDAVITTMDLSSVTAQLKQRTQALLTAQVEQAEDMEELYDEDQNFRQELVLAALSEAVDQALAQDAETVSRPVKMNLIYTDGSWWVIPDQALLQGISGNLMNGG